MGMVVRTNMGAINATRNLNKNQKGQMGSLEKLASGFKINRAADDASGLSISEKMKAQIKALNTASENAANGQDMISTAEGYLNEVHDMLNRMVELAMKSANGTFETANLTGGVNTTANSGAVYGAGTDRNALQSEMNQLCAEIDRIAIQLISITLSYLTVLWLQRIIRCWAMHNLLLLPMHCMQNMALRVILMLIGLP